MIDAGQSIQKDDRPVFKINNKYAFPYGQASMSALFDRKKGKEQYSFQWQN